MNSPWTLVFFLVPDTPEAAYRESVRAANNTTV